MSDLQLSLLVIGAMVIGAVYVYNVIQERNFRRRVEQAFGEAPEDVLLRRGADTPDERVEPQLGDAPDPEPRPRRTRSSASSREPEFDPELDYVAGIEADAPLPEQAVAALISKVAECGKPAR